MQTTLIGIAGGTASGKTTVAQKVFHEAKKFGSVVVIRLDDYYKEMFNLNLSERANINYDHPDSYDSQLLVSHLKLLKQGLSIEKPTYDFVVHNRSKDVEIINPANVVIVEGIMVFAIPELKNLFDIKLFVDTPDDIRFIRRLNRDIEHRGRTVESVVNQYLSTVRPMHLLFVEPSKKFADIIIPEGGENQVAIDFITTKIVDLFEK